MKLAVPPHVHRSHFLASRTRRSARIVVILGFVLLAGALIPSSSGPVLPVSSSPRGVVAPAEAAVASTVLAEDACSNGSLQSIVVTPQIVTVSASGSQTFSARGVSNCGTNVTGLMHFSWRLSSVTVGSLASSSGPTVVYTACVAPMDGILRLVGSLGSVNLTANATIRIGGGSFGNVPGTPAAPVLGNASTNPLSREAGLALVGTLLLGGILVLVWGLRSGPRRPSH